MGSYDQIFTQNEKHVSHMHFNIRGFSRPILLRLQCDKFGSKRNLGYSAVKTLFKNTNINAKSYFRTSIFVKS